MQIEDELGLDPLERDRLSQRQEQLRVNLRPLKEAAEGEEPLFNVLDLEDVEP